MAKHEKFSYGVSPGKGKNYVQLSHDAGVEASAIREILSVTQGRPEIISLAGGLPDSGMFESEKFLSILSDLTHGKCLDHKGRKIEAGDLYQYAPSEGVPFFFETLNAWINKTEDFGTLENENLLVISAAQQGLDLFAKAFIDPCREASVIVGAPTYVAELNVLGGRSGNLEIIGIPLDEKGMQVEQIWDLPKEKLAKCKYIYAVPTFDNPAGTELSEKRRKELIDISNEFGIPIIEDEPYACLRYEGKKLHSIMHYDDIGCTVRLQTFSKMAAPGLRLGYMAGSKELVSRIRVMLQSSTLCASSLNQYMLAEFMRRGWLEQYWAKVIPVYRERMNAMLGAMDEHLTPYGSWVKPKGGLFVWLTLNEINGDALFREAIKKNVAIVGGSSFFPPNSDKKLHNSARLNFSKSNPAELRTAIERLGAACAALDKK
ncbi:MAG: PLP-dependent aminotransferase family protein [Candidatus Diapherotrites archaeon]|nr:PLP-dependent aminotransferase family protein [Candidatus Diapherotrites archaeon]